MPIIKSAKKKLRKDRKRTVSNQKVRSSLKSLIKKLRREPGTELLQQVSSSLDKAAKVKLIHPNKASRLKSRLSKIVPLIKPS